MRFMQARELTSAGDVIEALGGPTAVARLTDRQASQVVSNWKTANSFPPNTFLVLTTALRERGLRAPAALWRMVEPSSPGEAA